MKILTIEKLTKIMNRKVRITRHVELKGLFDCSNEDNMADTCTHVYFDQKV